MSSTPREAPTEEALQHRLFELQALHDVAREIASLQDVRAILREAALTLAGTLGTRLAVGALINRQTRCLERVFDMGLVPGAQVQLDEVLVEYPDVLAGSPRVQILSAAERDPLAAGLFRSGVRLWVPLATQDGTRAGLGLGERMSGAAYDDDDRHLLETIQSLVQQALHNAELYQAQQEANAELERLNRALEARVQNRTEALEAAKTALSQSGESGEFIGESAALRQVLTQLRQVASTDLTVLILGETGTGKGLAARTLHGLSPRREGPFIQVNCGALPQHLVESELFGHEKGAFTGAHARKIGKVELAADGTLFLDEIGDMPLEAQVKLLRLLEEQVFERVGGTQTLPVQVRVVAATNWDLEALVAEKRFRGDLFYRLQGFPVEIPPLRERREDIPLLTRFMVERFVQHLHRPMPEIAPTALTELQAATWPGNVRELENLLQRAVLVCRDNCIEAADVADTRASAPAPATEGPLLSLADNEKQHLRRALEASEGALYGQKGAAQLLDVHPETLRYRLKKHDLLELTRRPK